MPLILPPAPPDDGTELFERRRHHRHRTGVRVADTVSAGGVAVMKVECRLELHEAATGLVVAEATLWRDGDGRSDGDRR